MGNGVPVEAKIVSERGIELARDEIVNVLQYYP